MFCLTIVRPNFFNNFLLLCSSQYSSSQSATHLWSPDAGPQQHNDKAINQQKLPNTAAINQPHSYGARGRATSHNSIIMQLTISNNYPIQQQSISNNCPIQQQSISNNYPIQQRSISNNCPIQQRSISNNCPILQLSIRNTTMGVSATSDKCQVIQLSIRQNYPIIAKILKLRINHTHIQAGKGATILIF